MTMYSLHDLCLELIDDLADKVFCIYTFPVGSDATLFDSDPVTKFNNLGLHIDCSNTEVIGFT